MKFPAAALSAALVLGLSGSPAAAQDDVATDVAAVRTCVVLTSSAVLDELEPAAVAAGLLAGEIGLEVVPADECAVLQPGEADRPARAAGTPYVDFVAHGAGAAIKLAALAQRHEDADTLPKLDRAARDLHEWAGAQRKWLDRHPPQACYAAAHAQWRDGVVDVREGAKDVRRAIKQLRAAPIERAVRSLSAGATKLAGVDLDAVTRRCLEAQS